MASSPDHVAPESSDAFVCEIPLRVSPAQERELLIRLDCARQIYNACLGEALRRLRLARESKAWQAAVAMPSKSKERKAAFKAVRERFGLSLYALISPPKHLVTRSWQGTCQFTSTWLGEHVDSQCVQVIAARAWATVDRYMVRTGGRPRFKRPGQMASIEAKHIKNPLRWEDNGVTWKGLRLIPDLKVLDRPEARHGVDLVARGGLRFVRLVHREIRGRHRFFAQLVIRGKPIVRVRAGEGVTGIDIGPSTIAIVGERHAELGMLAPGIERSDRQRRVIQRALDRSRRKTNPDGFRPDGTVVPGRRVWVRSRRFLRLQRRLVESDRRMAATRKGLHAQLAKRIVESSSSIHLERLSYVALQKCFGRSTGVRAAGLFVSILHRMAESAGVDVVEIDPWRTRLSQTCLCGRVEKKVLSERVHRCLACGVIMQRDLMSAYLARFVTVDGTTLQADQALAAWSGTRSMALQAAWSDSQTVDGADLTVEHHAAPPGATERRSPANTSPISGEASDAVVREQSTHESRGVPLGCDVSVSKADTLVGSC